MVAYREAGSGTAPFDGREMSLKRASGSATCSLRLYPSPRRSREALIAWCLPLLIWFSQPFPEGVALQGSKHELCLADKERCVELKKALCTAHEKFCFWPDSPCPGWCLRAHVHHYSLLFPPFLSLLLSSFVRITIALQAVKAMSSQSSFSLWGQ